jgi:hypothetical protein
MSRARRWIAGIAVLGLLVAVPVALAVGGFGPVETADPERWVGSPNSDSTQLAADGSGNAIFGSVSGDRMAVYARCGGSPATWRRTLLGSAHAELAPVGVAMNASGAALAVWTVPAGGGAVTVYSSSRPAGGDWGSQQVIVTAELGAAVEFAVGGNGEAVAAWNQGNPAVTRAAIRPAGGDWADVKTLADVPQPVRVAMSESGAAIVVSYVSAGGKDVAYYRPPGGPWQTGVETVMTLPASPGVNQRVQFDGDGRAVVVAGLNGNLFAAARGAGGVWTDPPKLLDSAQTVSIGGLARLPHGVAAIWGNGDFGGQVGVSRLGTAWEDKHLYTNGGFPFARGAIGADAAGRVLIAVARQKTGVGEIWGATVALGDALPDNLERLSPPGDTGPLYRDPVAAGGGSTLFLGWGVHGTNQDHSEAIATAPAPASCDGTPAATPTATATATPTVQPQPQPLPQPQPQPQPKLPKAIGGFVALPKASHCLRTSKLTFRVKRPKGFAVKQIAVKVNGRRVKLVKGRALLHAIALRHLPRRSFTVAVDVKLSDGRKLHGKRHYKRCA